MHSVKRFISVFLLCVILPFLLLQPLSSSADNGTFSVQGTEYQKPRFFPPDIDYSVYSHYFLLMYGPPDAPVYRLYAIENECVSEDFIRFQIALTSDSTCFHRYGYTEHSVTTSYYRTTVFSFDTSTGLSSYSFLDSDIIGWVFDDYSVFDSSRGSYCKYIIGANCDIYDYAGNLLRAGDYDNLCSFFVGGLEGSSDKSQNPVPAETTTGVGSGGGSTNIDLGNIPDLLANILNKLDVLGTLADSLDAVATSISAVVISDKLDQIITQLSNILGRMFNLEQLENYLDNKFSPIASDIFELKKAFLDFVTVGNEIKKLPSLFGDIGLQFSSLINDLNDTLDGISAYFGDDNIIGDIKGNIATLRSNTETIISKLVSIIDCLSDLSGKIKDCYSELHNISYYSKWINDNIRSVNDRLFNFGEALFVTHLPAIETVLSGISDAIVGFSLDFSRFRVFFDTYAKGVVETIVDIYKLLKSLPENISSLLKELFIPKEDHFSGFDDIKKHFEFVNQILKIGDAIVDSAKFYKKPPVFNFNFSHELFGEFSVKLDFGIIPYKYVVFVRNFIRGVTLIVFVRRTRKRLPDVINGCGG